MSAAVQSRARHAASAEGVQSFGGKVGEFYVGFTKVGLQIDVCL